MRKSAKSVFAGASLVLALITAASRPACAAVARNDRPTVVVLPFENLSGQSWTVLRQLGSGRDESRTTGVDRYARTCHSQIEDQIISSRTIQVVERTELNRVLEETVFYQGPYASKQGGLEFGRQLGAQLLVQGTILPTVAHFEVDPIGRQDQTSIIVETVVQLKITAVESGTVVFAESYPGRVRHVLGKIENVRDEWLRSVVIAQAGPSSLKSNPLAGGDLLLAAIKNALRAAVADPRWIQRLAQGPPEDISASGVAVLPFSNLSGSLGQLSQERWDGEQRGRDVVLDRYAVAARLAVEEIVVDYCTVPVADRDQIEKTVIQELEFDAASGMVSQKSASELGRMVAARFLVLGSLEPADVRVERDFRGPPGLIRSKVETALRIQVIDHNTGAKIFSKTFPGEATYTGPRRDFLSDGYLLVWALKVATHNARNDEDLKELLTYGPRE